MANKKGAAIPFEWMFAMIAGGIILFLAIFAAVRLMEGGERVSNTEIAAKINALLDPYETGIASGTSSEIKFSRESKLYFDECSWEENQPFGKQVISFTDKTIKKYGEKGEGVDIKNKYVFADDVVVGKNFYIFSMPFFMAFKVGDVIIIDSRKYCFYQAPREIEEQITNTMGDNNYINFSDDIDACSGIKVCFGIDNAKCNVKVFGECAENCKSEYDFGRVVKKNSDGKNTEMYYIHNLVFGAIFSSPDIYDCNVRRFMAKFNELGKIYIDKIKIISMKGCDSQVEGKLSSAMNSAKAVQSSNKISENLILLGEEAKNVEIINQAVAENCRLFESE